jgi:hypothetical protein
MRSAGISKHALIADVLPQLAGFAAQCRRARDVAMTTLSLHLRVDSLAMTAWLACASPRCAHRARFAYCDCCCTAAIA